MEVVQYSEGITSVQWGNSVSTVEGIQYIGEITSVLWRVFSTVGEEF